MELASISLIISGEYMVTRRDFLAPIYIRSNYFSHKYITVHTNKEFRNNRIFKSWHMFFNKDILKGWTLQTSPTAIE